VSSANDRGVPYPRRIRLANEAYADTESLFHVTIHTHPEVGALRGVVRSAIWGVVMEQATAARVQLVAACLMPDHLHMLVRPGDQDLLRFLNVFKSWATRRSWAAGHRGPLWQPGMWDRTVRGGDDFAVTLRYVVENPVRAGLVEDAELWPHTWVAEL
jgi:REP element-mobilizing transposase RayT